MSVAPPRARQPAPSASRRRTLANSPNRRREVARVVVWALFAATPAFLIPYLLL